MRVQRAEWENVVTELVATRGDALQRYAMLLCGSREQAADLVQDALVKTFGRLRNGFSVAQSVITDFGSGFVMDDYIMAKDLT